MDEEEGKEEEEGKGEEEGKEESVRISDEREKKLNKRKKNETK